MFAIAAVDALVVPSRVLVGAAMAYLVVAAGAEWLGHRVDRVAVVATGAMLLVDGLFLALAVLGTGGAASVLQFLLYLQLLAVSLLASYRVGLLMAAWNTLLFVAAAALGASAAPRHRDRRGAGDEPGRVLDVRPRPGGLQRPQRTRDGPATSGPRSGRTDRDPARGRG